MKDKEDLKDEEDFISNEMLYTLFDCLHYFERRPIGGDLRYLLRPLNPSILFGNLPNGKSIPINKQ